MNSDTLAAAVLVIVAAVVFAVTRQRRTMYAGIEELPEEEPTQQTSIFEDVIVAATPSTYMSGSADPQTADANVQAFLDMIAFAEGTLGPDGYRTMFGYRKFDSYADHPRVFIPFTDKAGRQLKTSAAGRYQFLARTWDELKNKLGLMDFSPASQDAACIELIRQRGALNDVKAGRIEQAIAKCAPIWASLPGAGYDQPERKLGTLLTAFNNAGGSITA